MDCARSTEAVHPDRLDGLCQCAEAGAASRHHLLDEEVSLDN